MIDSLICSIIAVLMWGIGFISGVTLIIPIILFLLFTAIYNIRR